MKKIKFLALRENIRKKRQSSQERRSCEIGKRREDKVESLLQELKDDKIIDDFLPTGNLSFQDIVKGIDFFVVYVDATYKVCRLSITGERWVEEHKRKHPEIPIVAVNPSDSPAFIKNKIMEAINNDK